MPGTKVALFPQLMWGMVFHCLRISSLPGGKPYLVLTWPSSTSNLKLVPSKMATQSSPSCVREISERCFGGKSLKIGRDMELFAHTIKPYLHHVYLPAWARSCP